MATYETHRVAERDKARIRCQSHRWHEACGNPANICEHTYWSTGNTTGVSFSYYCNEGYKALVKGRKRGTKR